MFTEEYLKRARALPPHPKFNMEITPVDENSPYDFALFNEWNETEVIEPPIVNPQTTVRYTWDLENSQILVTTQNQYHDTNEINHKVYAIRPKKEKKR